MNPNPFLFLIRLGVDCAFPFLFSPQKKKTAKYIQPLPDAAGRHTIGPRQISRRFPPFFFSFRREFEHRPLPKRLLASPLPPLPPYNMESASLIYFFRSECQAAEHALPSFSLPQESSTQPLFFRDHSLFWKIVPKSFSLLSRHIPPLTSPLLKTIPSLEERKLPPSPPKEGTVMGPIF